MQTWVADVGAAIESARLLTLHTAWKVDKSGCGEARTEISMIKYVVPRGPLRRHRPGNPGPRRSGFSCDMPLEAMYREARNAPIVDGT